MNDESVRHAPAAGAILLLSALLAPAPLTAGEQPRAPGYLTFYLDNDLFSGSDRGYTNGFRASWIAEGDPRPDLGPLRRTLQGIAGLGGPEDDSGAGTPVYAHGFSLTQRMYTPDDPLATSQPPGQRRYAGWLGLGFSVHASSARRLRSAELILGTIGPDAKAEAVQDFIHDLTDTEEFQAWDDQVPNEVTLDLALSEKRRLPLGTAARRGFGADGFTEWTVRLGTFRTLARAGGFLRVGFNLPADFSDPRLSATAYSHKYFRDGRGPSEAWSAYALLGAYGDARLHDATLDGPVFRDFETGNERETLVGSAFAGFGLRWRFVELSYVHTLRSRTFEEQEGSRDFGSVALRVRL